MWQIDFIEELANAPIVPNPVEYEDIDRAVFDFFRDNIEITDENGERIPTFRLFSNQRFTEYSQTWKHTDKDGNLLMNFKTVSREPNPQNGRLHNGMANIPGGNRFTACMREIVDKNGVECYEITSMSQPVQADMVYTIGLVCSKMDKLNTFNMRFRLSAVLDGWYTPILVSLCMISLVLSMSSLKLASSTRMSSSMMNTHFLFQMRHRSLVLCQSPP